MHFHNNLFSLAVFIYTQTSKNTFTTTSRYPNPVNFCHNFCHGFPDRRWRFHGRRWRFPGRRCRFHGHGFLGRGLGFLGFVGFCPPWPWFTGFCPPSPGFPGFCIVEFCPPLPGFPEFCPSPPVFGPPIGAPQEVPMHKKSIFCLRALKNPFSMLDLWYST